MSTSSKSVKAALHLEKMYFDKIDYRRNGIVSGEPEYRINFSREITVNSDDEFVASLQANISDENDTMELHVRIVGEFRCELGENNHLRDSFVNKNSIAILFPYLRSQISLVTTQPDMQPIVLPPMNIVDMFND